MIEMFAAETAQPLPLVIAMHGFSGKKEDCFNVCYSLARQGYYAVTMDLHLHGEAGAQPFDPSILGPRLQEVVAGTSGLLDSLLDGYAQNPHVDPKRAALLGFSLGGVVAYHFLSRRAQAQPDQPLPLAAAVVMIAGMPHAWPDTLRRIQPLFPHFGVTDAMIAAADASTTASPEDFLEGVVDFPLLMLYGQADPVVPVEAARSAHRAAQARYPRPGLLQLVEFPGVGHETPPAMLAQAAAWLAQHLAPTPPAPLLRLPGANMDIDLATPPGEITWAQAACPWNTAEGTLEHRCAVKNVSLCPYFRGVDYVDTLLCAYEAQRDV